ncbi:hypothetical protein CLIB1423_02S06986 [[Candida] railenensis]|uniref:Uncharacterized protein n=1 Tax=[Candida] railenensis TaxID=45579 RepID=A0A9P0QLT1_9ASCO|nr:hypothetical protein CLIB1423_02S06986 [[Candida] railenensis]
MAPSNTQAPPIIGSTNSQQIKFAAIISRDDKPLYLQAFEPDVPKRKNANNFLKYNFLSHMSLDVFSSSSSLNLREQQKVGENDALLLFIQDGITVYGYETNTNLKIIVGLGVYEEYDDSENGNEDEKEDEREGGSDKEALGGADLEIIEKTGQAVDRRNTLNSIFSQIHKSYLRVICNPFTNLAGHDDTVLQTPTFDNAIKKIVSQWN